MSGYVAISGKLTGEPVGSINVGPFSIAPNGDDLLYIATFEFVMGNTTVTIPNYSAGMIIVPDPTNTIYLTLKGVNADTGFGISHNTPSLISFPTSLPGSVVIDAAADTSTQTTIMFF